MLAGPAFQHLNEHAAEEAFDIAWQFVRTTHDVADEFAAQAFIASEIVRLLDRGERNKIRLANRAIAAYEQAHPEHIDHLLALGDIGR
jgi:hypothetical protein